MDRRIAILGAAGLGLGLAMPAHAQLALDWIDTPSADDDRTKRLEDEAVSMAKADGADTADRTRPPTAHPHTVSFDYVYPVALNEYRALGANGVLFVSVVAHDPKELPLKRVVIRSGAKEVVLQPISDRRSTVPPTSRLAKTVGVNRQDAFFLLPGKLPGKTAELWMIFSVPGRQFHAGSLSSALSGDFQAVPPGQPDEAALKEVLAREYPDLVKPYGSP